MKIRNKEKIEVYMTDQLKIALKQRSLTDNCSMAKIVKTALELYLK
jgi:hypothetical protein